MSAADVTHFPCRVHVPDAGGFRFTSSRQLKLHLQAMERHGEPFSTRDTCPDIAGQHLPASFYGR
jgi:hypothetical protein